MAKTISKHIREGWYMEFDSETGAFKRWFYDPDRYYTEKL